MEDFGVGVDIEPVERFEDILSKKNFLEKTYTAQEIEYCKAKPNPSQHLAARFAAKEAVVKALGSLGIKLTVGEIEIDNERNGAPKVILKHKGLEKFNVKLSIAHAKGNAIAFAVAVK